MGRLLFIPFGIAAGLIAGLVGKFAFDKLWGLIDEQEPPEPEHREASMPKLVAALALEGAIFRTTRGIVEHGARRSFQRFTGEWPGEPRPETE